jgi:hypothetical protein
MKLCDDHLSGAISFVVNFAGYIAIIIFFHQEFNYVTEMGIPLSGGG